MDCFQALKQAGETSNLEPRGTALRLLPSEASKHAGPVYGFDITPEKKIKKKDGDRLRDRLAQTHSASQEVSGSVEAACGLGLADVGASGPVRSGLVGSQVRADTDLVFYR